jgi:hypothetical protein
MTGTHRLLTLAVLGSMALCACGARPAGTTDTLPATTDAAPPPVDPAVPGAPEGVLPAPPELVAAGARHGIEVLGPPGMLPNEGRSSI